MSILTFDQGTIVDLHNVVVDLIEAISIHDNGENCPYCGTDYIEVGEDEYRCADAECTGNVALDLVVKVRNADSYKNLEGLKNM